MAAGNITNYVTSKAVSDFGLQIAPIGAPIDGSDGWYSDGTYSYYVSNGSVQSYETDPCYTAPPPPAPPPPPPPPGGDPCLIYGTPIQMADGSQKLIEDLVVGDVICSLSINGLNTNDEKNWTTYSTNMFQYTKSSATIVGLKHGSYRAYYVINNIMGITYEHPVFINRNGVYLFCRVENLMIGDLLFNHSEEFIPIETIQIINEHMFTVSIDIEEDDVYFGSGILVHNREEDKV